MLSLAFKSMAISILIAIHDAIPKIILSLFKQELEASLVLVELLRASTSIFIGDGT